MEKTKRTRPSKSVTFTLNPKNPVEQALIKILEEKRSLRTSSHRYAYGTELIRELVLLGTETIEQRFPGQIINENKAHLQMSNTRRAIDCETGKSNFDIAGTVPL